MSQFGLTLRIWDIFEFQTFFKNADPPPLTKLGHFWISDISYKGNNAKYTINIVPNFLDFLFWRLPLDYYIRLSEIILD